jgi:ribonuclease III
VPSKRPAPKSGTEAAATPSNKADLSARLHHHFRRAALLERALTHSSHANEAEHAHDNEGLEFLGDAVLGMVTSEALFERYPHFTEGRLSKTRAHLVSARHLIKVARQLGLGDHLRLGRGEERSGGRQKSALLVDALEAVIAALYLDGGMEAARRFVLREIVAPELERVDRDPELALAASDQKSALQEFVQALGQPQPSYHVIEETGPDHRKIFTVELRVRTGADHSEIVQRGEGATKKAAEQRAAQKALEILKPEARK